MAVSNKKLCTICGKEYAYCPTCERLGGWKYYTDTPECFQIFMILSEIREGVITKEEAKTNFGHIGITSDYDYSNLIPAVADVVKDIVTDNVQEDTESKPKAKKTKKTT